MAEITRVLNALIVRVGVDLAKNVIQVHAVDASGRRVVARTRGGVGSGRWDWMRG